MGCMHTLSLASMTPVYDESHESTWLWAHSKPADSRFKQFVTSTITITFDFKSQVLTGIPRVLCVIRYREKCPYIPYCLIKMAAV